MKSRFETEFEEIGFIGKGGFGSVVKCRLRRKASLDKEDIYFAVKKIKLPHSRTQDNDDKFVLREASNLASLHHKNIVRYFSAWLEESEARKASVYSVHRRLPKILPVATAPLYFSTRSLVQQDWLSIHDDDPKDPPSFVKAILREQLMNEDAMSVSSGGSSEEQIMPELTSSSEGVVFEHSSPPSTRLILSSWGESTPLQMSTVSSKKMLVDRCLHIAMEYVSGLTLRQAIANASFVRNKRLLWDVFHQICEGLSFMHQHQFVHRDLKPENIFLKTEDPWTAKIGDFGLSTFLDHRQPGQNADSTVKDDTQLSVGVGTRFYIAPEVLQKEGKYDQAADMFSLGVILYEMFTPPVKTSMERFVSLSQLIDSEGKAAEALGLTDKLAQTLIARLLVKEPTERITALRMLQFVPHKTSGDQILDIVTANPFSHEMLRLLTSLFGRHESEERAKRFWENYSLPNLFVSKVVTELKAYTHCLFRTFNAVQIDLPVLTPQAERQGDPQPFRVIDASGMPLVLPMSLLRLMKDTLGSVQLATVVKRFGVEDVFFGGGTWDCPQSALRIVFDAAVNLSKLEQLDRVLDQKDEYRRLVIFESDPVRVLWVIGQGFMPWLGEGGIIFTFSSLLPLLLRVILKLPNYKSKELASVIRSPRISRQAILTKLRNIFTIEIKAGKMAVKDLETHVKMIEQWRQNKHPHKVCESIREMIVLEDPSEPQVCRLTALLIHAEILVDVLTASLGKPMTEAYVEMSICLGFDESFFDLEDSLVFAYHVKRPTAAMDSVLKYSPGFGGIINDPHLKLLGVGGRYSSSGNEIRAAFGVEIDIQVIIDSILISTTDPASIGSEVSRWKSTWRNHLARKRILSIDTSEEDSGIDEVPSRYDVEPAKQFLLLPPSTPIDTIKWLKEIQGLVRTASPIDTEVEKLSDNWRLAFETAMAPPLLRRFNPLIQTSVPHPDRAPCMVLIMYQTEDLIVAAFTLKTRLSNLRITATICSETAADMGKARKRAHLTGVCDWLVYVCSRQSAVRYRLCAVHASNYLRRSDLLRGMDELFDSCDRWYDDSESLRAQLVSFYVELLAVMSPSSGHLFSDTTSLLENALGQ